MNRRLKRVAESAILASGVPRLTRRAHRSRVLVLAYHNIVPTGEVAEGDATLHLPQREFAQQLDAIRRTHDVVPLASIFDAPGVRGRPRVVITFDDAYAGALDAGLRELARRDMPSTVFVAPGLLGRVTWWDALSRPGGAGLPEAVRNHALVELAGKGDGVVSWAKSSGNFPAELQRRPRIARLEEIERAVAESRVTLGSHTWSHPNLRALTDADVREELSSSFEWLRAWFPDATIPWLSYPYGFWSEPVRDIAAEVGYAAAVRVEGGWVAAEGARAPYEIPRLNVPFGMSVNGLSLRLAGIAAGR
ncbi:MAG TPA: polysaccharide deacetylase family protein [Gemmatimonadaceae bacterium]|jgi:peptidoglycan/xylan/chitin deacetylase (PgdA/CDA1 family)|nr:polysaccharide deacetylase family protein [Gemmatimonadaceae bacterium]